MQGLRFCISHHFRGDVNAGGPWSTLEEEMGSIPQVCDEWLSALGAPKEPPQRAFKMLQRVVLIP